MRLHPVPLNLTEKQFHNLASGKGVKIAKHHLVGGSISVGLSKAQINRLTSRVQSGNGLTSNIKLTQKQLEEHVQHGSGWFSDLVRKVWNKSKVIGKTVYKELRPIVEPVLREVGNTLKTEGLELINQGLQHGKIAANNRIRQESQKIKNNIGIQSGLTQDVQIGQGFLGDALRKSVKLIQPIANEVVKEVLPVVVPLIKDEGVAYLKRNMRGGNIVVTVNKPARRRTRVAKRQAGGALYF